MNSFAFAVIAASTLHTSERPLDPNDVKPGWVALSIVVILCVATFFLLRSFIKHARKAGEPWEGEQSDPKLP
ncbi:MAG: hypothetical protein ABIR57_11680 [Aeromicrobium sp.]